MSASGRGEASGTGSRGAQSSAAQSRGSRQSREGRDVHDRSFPSDSGSQGSRSITRPPTEVHVVTPVLQPQDDTLGSLNGSLQVRQQTLIRDLVGNTIFPRLKFITDRMSHCMYTTSPRSLCQLMIKHCNYNGSEKEKHIWWTHYGAKWVLRKMTDCRNNRCTEMQRMWMSTYPNHGIAMPLLLAHHVCTV